MSFPDYQRPFLPPNTIVPNPVDDTDTFIQYMNRLYEDIAFAMNQKDVVYFQIPISPTPAPIPNINTFGAYVVCVSGIISSQPTGVWALCKSNSGNAGVGLTPLTFQPGTGGIWGTFNLAITSSGSNFLIAHNAAVTANFNIRIIGTQ